MGDNEIRQQGSVRADAGFDLQARLAEAARLRAAVAPTWSAYMNDVLSDETGARFNAAVESSLIADRQVGTDLGQYLVEALGPEGALRVAAALHATVIGADKVKPTELTPLPPPLDVDQDLIDLAARKLFAPYREAWERHKSTDKHDRVTLRQTIGAQKQAAEALAQAARANSELLSLPRAALVFAHAFQIVHEEANSQPPGGK